MINIEVNNPNINFDLGRVIIRSVSYSEYEVLNSLGDLLFSGRIESGQTASIVAPDAYYYLRDSEGNFVLSGQVPSQTTEYVSLSDSYYTLFNSEGTFIGSGSTLYGQTSLVTAPNASYTLVNSSGDTLSSSTIVSNGFQEIFAPNATYILIDNEGSFVSSGQTASGRESLIIIQKSENTKMKIVDITETTKVSDIQTMYQIKPTESFDIFLDFKSELSGGTMIFTLFDDLYNIRLLSNSASIQDSNIYNFAEKYETLQLFNNGNKFLIIK